MLWFWLGGELGGGFDGGRGGELGDGHGVVIVVGGGAGGGVIWVIWLW